MDTPQARRDADDTEEKQKPMNQAKSTVEHRTIEKGTTETMNSSIAIVAPPSTPNEEHVYDPNKITLKFIFANRDGVNVILDCSVSSTVAEVKGALLSMWPKGEINTCSLNCPNQLIDFGFY